MSEHVVRTTQTLHRFPLMAAIPSVFLVLLPLLQAHPYLNITLFYNPCNYSLYKPLIYLYKLPLFFFLSLFQFSMGKKNSGETENKEEDNNPNNNNNGGSFLNILLKVDLHCEGCTKRIKKYVLKFPGVYKVEIEGENKVKIMAQKDVDAAKLRDKLQKKTLKRFELVTPQPTKTKDKKKENGEEQKPKEVQVTTVVLKMQYHCHGCVERIHKAFNAYKGVHEVKLDKEKCTVKVTGRIEVKKMIEEVSKKLRRPIEIVPEKKEKEKDKDKEKENKQGNNNNNNNGENNTKKDNVKVEYLVNGSGYMGICDGSGWVLQIFETPQYFSDDNPNACFIM